MELATARSAMNKMNQLWLSSRALKSALYRPLVFQSIPNSLRLLTRVPRHPTARTSIRCLVDDQRIASSEGLRSMHGMASSNYLQLGVYRDNRMKIETCSFKGRVIAHRFYSGGPVLWSLIGTNVAVCAMWYKLNTDFMNRHFMVSIDHVVWRKRYHTLVTAAFSHYKMDHLLFNLFGLFCFGSMIERIYGGPTLLLLYLGGAVSGSLGHMLYGFYYPLLKKIPVQYYNFRAAPPALGASGAVTTLTMLHMLLFPKNLVLLMFVPMPAALAGALIIGLDVYRAKKGNTGISVGSHFGGAWVAACFYLILWFEGKIPPT